MKHVRAKKYHPAESERTLCGAEPTAEDVDRHGALHVLTSPTSILQPEWGKEICESCAAKVLEKHTT